MTAASGAGSPIDATPAYCGHCGQGLDTADHASCMRALTMEPPRFCGVCQRRMKVQVTPTGWRAECSRHGELTAPREGH